MNNVDPSVKTLSRRGRRIAWIVALCSLGLDISITALEIITDQLVEGRGPILDSWDLLKLVGIAVVLLYAAGQVKSRGLTMFAGVFFAIGITDQFFAIDRIADWLVEAVSFGGLGSLIPGDSAAWVELLLLTLLASAGLILLLTTRDSWPGYRRVRNVMFALLAVLAFFAIGVDLVAASSSFTDLATLVEETGERVTSSIILAYVTGLGITIRNRHERPV